MIAISTMKQKLRTLQKRRSAKKKFLLLGSAGALILIIAVVAFLEATDRTFFFHDKPQLPTANQHTKGEPAGSTGTPNKNGSSGPAQDEPTGTPSENKATQNNQNVKLLKPDGTFISAHHVKLSDSPKLQSNCTTTPGATCTITFTKNGTVKQLQVKTTDAGGSTFWEWDLKSIGIGAGSWKVQAVAKLGSQTETADDAMTLEVSE